MDGIAFQRGHQCDKCNVNVRGCHITLSHSIQWGSIISEHCVGGVCYVTVARCTIHAQCKNTHKAQAHLLSRGATDVLHVLRDSEQAQEQARHADNKQTQV